MGEVGFLRDAVAEQVTLFVPGRSQLAGRYDGIDGIGRFLWLRKDLCDGSLELFGADTSISRSQGFVCYGARARRREQELVSNEVIICGIEEGRVIRAFLYVYDLYAFDAFWS